MAEFESLNWWKACEALAIRYGRCPYCDVKPGERCSTKSGRIAESTHHYRVRPFLDIYMRGYREGEEEAYEMFNNHPESFARMAQRHKETA